VKREMNPTPNIEAQDEDKLLLKKFQQGDNNAFDELAKKYQDRIYRQCYYFTHDAGDALDLTQEIFIRIFQSLGSFREQSSFYTWLCRIIYNICVDYSRHKKAYLDAENIYSEYAFSNAKQSLPNKLAEAKELENEISKAMDMLSARTRSAIILRYYEGLDYKSISEILGCRISAVKANISKGMRMLRNILPSYLTNDSTNCKGGELTSYKGVAY
jgi:RNA polymerase sigma-70 factor (ECF subfamily)